MAAALPAARNSQSVPGGHNSHRIQAGLPTPIAYWKLDDNGPQALDSVGGHHGVIQGAKSHEGKSGKALLFDRQNGDHGSVPHSTDFEIGTYTVSAWVWLTIKPTFSGVV